MVANCLIMINLKIQTEVLKKNELYFRNKHII